MSAAATAQSETWRSIGRTARQPRVARRRGEEQADGERADVLATMMKTWSGGPAPGYASAMSGTP